MNEQIVQLLYFMGSYVGVFFLTFFILNILSKGWLYTFMAVKLSQGRKILTTVHAKTDTYYRAGKFDGEVFKYTPRNGKTKTYAKIPDGCIYSTMGVYAIAVDEASDVIYSRSTEKIYSPNAQETDSLIDRAIKAPSIDDRMEKAMLVLLLIAVVGIVVVGFMVVDLRHMVEALGKLSGNI